MNLSEELEQWTLLYDNVEESIEKQQWDEMAEYVNMRNAKADDIVTWLVFGQ